MKVSVLLVLVMLLVSARIHCQAREHRERPLQAPPAHSCPVVLMNGTGRELSFQTSSTDKDPWVTESISERSDYSLCIGSGTPGRSEDKEVYVRIGTKTRDNSTVVKHYRLLAGNRYRISWNKLCECWDLALVVPPK